MRAYLWKPHQVRCGLLLTLLFINCTYAQETAEQDYLCGLSREETRRVLDRETRVWTVTDGILQEHEIQAIVNCTREGDTISLETTRRIRPVSRIVIPWRLIIGRMTEVESAHAAVDLRASMTCPQGDGLFLVRGTAVVFRNLIIERCSLTREDNVRAIIESERCGSRVNAPNLIELANVTFRRNANLRGSVGLSVRDASCYTVVMQDVVFRHNQYTRSCELSQLNTLQDIQLTNNTLARGTRNRESLFLFPEASDTSVTNLTAEDNWGTLLKIERAVIDITNANISGNSLPGRGAIVGSSSNVSISSSVFALNDCRRKGAAVYLSDGSSGTFVSNRFLNNSASEGGALYLEDALDIDLRDSEFESNIARTPFSVASDKGGGGAFQIRHGGTSPVNSLRVSNCIFRENDSPSGGGGISISGWNDGILEIKNSRFLENNASFHTGKGRGGAIAVHSSRNISISVSNSIFRENVAAIGGAIELREISGRVGVRSTRFVRNRVSGGSSHGAGLAIMYTLELTNFTFRNTLFEENAASRRGGALFGESENNWIHIIDSSFLRNKANYSGGAVFTNVSYGVDIRACSFEENEAGRYAGALGSVAVSTDTYIKRSRFVNNKAALNGGGFSIASEVSVSDSFFENNEAVENGGAVFVNSGPLFVSNSSFTGNTAAYGGALHSSGSVVAEVDAHCRFENNTAVLYGGALYIAIPESFYRFYVTNATIVRNRAIIGGGAFFRVDSGSLLAFRPLMVRDVSFEDNFAEKAGGAYFIDSISFLDTDCNLDAAPSSLPSRGYFISNFNCTSMRGNSVGPSGYGDNIVTSSTNFTVAVIQTDRPVERIEAGNSYSVSNWRSGDVLPDFEVLMVDYYGQGPAFTRSLTAAPSSVNHSDRLPGFDTFVRATAACTEGLIENPVIVDVHSGRGVISPGGRYARPGNYSLAMSTAVNDTAAANVTIDIMVRECIVNEESTRNNTLCASCDSNHFNFHPREEKCKICPENADCASAFVLPESGHWNAFPCSARVQKCINEEACKGARAAAVTEMLKHESSDCDFSQALKDWYSAHLCEGGYTGALCGSCSDSYGRLGISACRECLQNGLSIVMIVVAVLVALTLTILQIKGNLHSVRDWTEKAIALAKQRSRRELEPISEARPSTNGVICSIEPSTSWYKQEESVARTKFVELLKITINFLQTVAAGVSLDVSWNDAIVELLRTWDWIGGAAIESSGLTVDCLLPTDWSTPRSVIRYALMICLPILMLLPITVFWTVRNFKLKKGGGYLTKRIALTALVVFYLSYISLTRAAINVFYCVDVYDGMDLRTAGLVHSYWAIDSAVRCYEGSHLILVFCVAIPLLLFALLFPILLALTLILARRSDSLNSDWVGEMVGLFFLGFEEDYVFWDSVILMRKALLAAVVVLAYPLGGSLQGLLAIGLLMFSLYLQTSFNPFKASLGNLNQMEGVSLLISSFTFLIGVLLNDANMNSAVLEVFLVALVFVCNVGLALFLMYQLIVVKMRQIKLGLLAEEIECESENDLFVLQTYFLLCFDQITDRVYSFLDKLY